MEKRGLAGVLTIVTTLNLFRILYNAAHSHVKAARVQDEILELVQKQSSSNPGSRRKMSLNTLMKEEKSLMERTKEVSKTKEMTMRGEGATAAMINVNEDK